MKLSAIIDAVPQANLSGDPQTEVTGLEHDSRLVKKGDIFAAVPGLTTDGHQFILQAVKAGATAIMTDRPLKTDPGVPVITVPEIRSGMASAAALIYGHPSDNVVMIGITGTNGKTTTTYLLESILARAGYRVGVIGTINARCPGRSWPAANTTPEGPDLQKVLWQMVAAGVSHVVMEVSSHALGLARVAGCRFDVGAFTNLTQDHLDFHQTMDAYYTAKRLLFTDYLSSSRYLPGPIGVVNVDDDWGRRLVQDVDVPLLTYGHNGQAAVKPLKYTASRAELSANLVSPVGPINVRTRLLGEINLYNIMTAVSIALILGLSPETISHGLEDVPGAPGRLERVGTNDDYLVLVDYAHTPDALSRALTAARNLNPRRLISVFGCGGDRDRTKRPIMGREAAILSDLAIITSDNPRTEDPASIVDQVEAGLADLNRKFISESDLNSSFEPGSYLKITDRRRAIRWGCRAMGPGDILVIAGKGHEDYQVLGRTKVHFDDREEARIALEQEGKN